MKNMHLAGAIETPPATAEFAAGLLEDLAIVLPAIGLTPMGVVLTQHPTRPDGVEPAVLMVLEQRGATTQLLDASRAGISTIFNDVLPRVTPHPGSAAPLAPAQAQAQPQQVAPVESVPAPETAPVAEAADTAAPDEARIWAAFEEAVRPQLGRGAAKAVQACRKASVGMSTPELFDFLSSRLENFGAQTLDSFRSSLQG